MAKNKNGLAEWFLGLPWLIQLLVAIFFDVVLGVIRLIDGIMQLDIIKILLGILWLAYGLVIGWIADIVCILIKRRPFFF